MWSYSERAITSQESSSPCPADAGETLMISCTRLVVAAGILLTVYVMPAQLNADNAASWYFLSAFGFYSAILCLLAATNSALAGSRVLQWLDLVWISGIVFLTHGVNSIFAPVFFFVILSAAFRRGGEEGARITLASAVLFIAGAAVPVSSPDFARLLLRTVFLLAFGYMSAKWGESKVRAVRRLALLREVMKPANPRFGTDHAIAALMQKTMRFFKGRKCILVVQEKGSPSCILHAAEDGTDKRAVTAKPVTATAVKPLTAFPWGQALVYSKSRSQAACYGKAFGCEHAGERWEKQDSEPAERVADLLEANHFISVSFELGKKNARLFVLSDAIAFTRTDALFLGQVVEQALPAIENIELVDRMASEAAVRERQKIAWDLHDMTIQPYIGLKLALHALQHKAEPGNRLADDIEKLIAMTEQVIGDLRRYARSFNQAAGPREILLSSQLRKKAAQLKEFYGIEIDITVDEAMSLSDRLAAELLHIIHEGLSNICKHTGAQRGSVKVRNAGGTIHIDIENENTRQPWSPFAPRSISERATQLGGKTRVLQGPDGSTVVHIEIPI
ncbi:MAG TPA: histidine kinase [Noviherbaspirillum sp.]|uniref:sensor histidine kinase n=1 Tax=Noviherbaspirillum sp. TaxID=1926288 RepID=UPI002D418A9A|nr:histidine kinase [Noviherbaspirillum sp.]HYD97601.1 histidine kinase [Noviherbaspirillum sp.]